MSYLKYIIGLFSVSCIGLFIAQVDHNITIDDLYPVFVYEDSVLKMTTSLSRIGEYDSMYLVAKKGEAYAVKHHSDSFYLGAFRSQMASALEGKGLYTEALKGYEFALEATANNEVGINEKGSLFYKIAEVEYNLGFYRESFESSKKAKELLQSIDHPDYDFLFAVYSDLSFQSKNLGYYKDAESYLSQAYKLHDQFGDQVIYIAEYPVNKPVTFEYQYTLLYAESGNEEKLLHHLEKLDSLTSLSSSNHNERLRYISALSATGDFYINNNNTTKNKDKYLKEAQIYLLKSLSLLGEDRYPSTYLQVTFNLSKLYALRGESKKAMQLMDHIFSEMKKGDKRECYFLAQKALILQQEKKFKKFLELNQQMIELIHSSDEKLKDDCSNFVPSNNISHAKLLRKIADTLSSQPTADAKELARCFYDCGMKVFENNFKNLLFNESLKDTYEGLLIGLLKKASLDNSNQEVLQAIVNKTESIENQLLWNEFLQNREYNNIGIPDSLRLKEREIRLQLTQEKNKDNQFELELALEKHLKLVKEKYPSYAKFNSVEFNCGKYQQGLKEADLVLRFFQTDGIVYRMSITSKDIQLTELDTATSVLIDQYIQVISSGKEDLFLAKKITEILLPTSMGDFKNLVVVSNGNIANLPFETLLSPKGNYLIENLNISYAPHLIFLSNTIKSQKSNADFVVFSPSYAYNTDLNELHGAKKESESLSENYQTKLYVGEKATKNHFFDAGKNASIMHLSMHAIIDPVDKNKSYLAFEDEKLYIDELYGVDLKADMVVLSACSTGEKNTTSSEGNVSVQRAFVYAGVPSTLSSLWEVPDEATRKIMLSFYSNLEDGLTKSEALKNAKMNYLETTTDTHLKSPFYWAGFVVSGDVSPVEFSKSTSSSYWILVLTIAVLLGFTVWAFSRRVRPVVN